MGRVMRWAGAAALLLAAAAVPAGASEVGTGAAGAAAPSETERRLAEVLAELEAQRLEIQALKAQVAAGRAEGGIEDAVRRYLESEDGQKALGRGRDDFRVFWKEGLNLQSGDRAHSLRIGGRMHWDWIFPDADTDVETAVGSEYVRTNQWRRARLQMSGTVYGNVYYSFQVEFGSSPHQFREMFIGVKDIPGIGNLQAGRMKEPFSLEELTGSNFMTFIERSVANALVRSFRAGVMTHNAAMEGRVGWAAGLFGDDDTRATGVVGNNVVGRVWAAPVFADGGATLVHVGLGYNRRDPEGAGPGGPDRLLARPGISIGGRPVDTGAFAVDTSETWGLEAAAVFGPFSVQGEYMQYAGDGAGPGASNPDFRAWYLMGSWFLTGEHRPWKDGAFGRVKPKTNFGKGGAGAFELAVRYAVLDLQDSPFAGGGQDVIDFGLNWYLNPNARVMLGYTMADVDHLGDVDTLALRMQVDF